MSHVSALDWNEYLQPTVRGRPTVKAFERRYEVLDPLSSLAREPRLLSLHEQLDRIASLPDNWDRRHSARPSQAAVENARQMLEDAYRQTAPAWVWQGPSLSVSEDGEIVMEWWNGIRKLTIYVGQNQSTYIKSWGPNLVSDMEDGELPENWISLHWAWLFE